VADAAHERQAAALRELEREVGQLTAQLAASTGRPNESSTDARTEAQTPAPPVDSPAPLPAVWMRWGPVLAVLGMVVVIALVLLFMPR
jgi:hypothetical protein